VDSIHKHGFSLVDVLQTSLSDLAKRVRTESGAIVDIPNLKNKDLSQDVSIIVKGDKERTEKAVNLLKSGLADLALYSFLATVPITTKLRPHIIGRGGAGLERMRVESGCLMDVARVTGLKQSMHSTSSSSYSTNPMIPHSHHYHYDEKLGDSDLVVIRGKTPADVAKGKAIVESVIQNHLARNARESTRHQNQPARIDDVQPTSPIRSQSSPQVSSNVSPRHPPGYVPKSERKNTNPPSIHSVVQQQEHKKSGFPSYDFGPQSGFNIESPNKNQEWVSVKQKNRSRAGTEVPEVGIQTPVVESESTSKKKKSKKTAAVPNTAAPVESTKVESKITPDIPASSAPSQQQQQQQRPSSSTSSDKKTKRDPSPSKSLPLSSSSSTHSTTNNNASTSSTTTSSKSSSTKPSSASQGIPSSSSSSSTSTISIPHTFQDFIAAGTLSTPPVEEEWQTVPSSNSGKNKKQKGSAAVSSSSSPKSKNKGTSSTTTTGSTTSAATNNSSLSSIPSLTSEGDGGATKKKKRKKKKKTNDTSVPMPGDESD